MSSSSTTCCIHCVKNLSITAQEKQTSCFHANQLKLYARKKGLIYAWCLCSLWSTHPHIQLFLCCVETDFMTAVNSVGLGMHFKHFHVKWIFNKCLFSGIWIRKTWVFLAVATKDAWQESKHHSLLYQNMVNI